MEDIFDIDSDNLKVILYTLMSLDFDLNKESEGGFLKFVLKKNLEGNNKYEGALKTKHFSALFRYDFLKEGKIDLSFKLDENEVASLNQKDYLAPDFVPFYVEDTTLKGKEPFNVYYFNKNLKGDGSRFTSLKFLKEKEHYLLAFNTKNKQEREEAKSLLSKDNAILLFNSVINKLLHSLIAELRNVGFSPDLVKRHIDELTFSLFIPSVTGKVKVKARIVSFLPNIENVNFISEVETEKVKFSLKKVEEKNPLFN